LRWVKELVARLKGINLIRGGGKWYLCGGKRDWEVVNNGWTSLNNRLALKS